MNFTEEEKKVLRKYFRENSVPVIKTISTSEIVNELVTRDGVITQKIHPHRKTTFDVDGPAMVLIVTD